MCRPTSTEDFVAMAALQRAVVLDDAARREVLWYDSLPRHDSPTWVKGQSRRAETRALRLGGHFGMLTARRGGEVIGLCEVQNYSEYVISIA